MATPPRILAHLDERPRIVVRPDGSLLGLTVAPTDDAAAWQLTGRTSDDGGVTWTAPEQLLRLSAEAGNWGGPQVLATADGEVHAFLMHDAGTGVFALPGRERQPKPMPARHLDVWHARTDGGGRRWRQPVRIWEGYTGSINAAIQTRDGRLVLPFARHANRTWSDRGEGLDAFWFAGTSDTIVLVSDDGETWRDTGAVLKCQTPNIGIYGAVEPVVVERGDGRLWMLARTQLGRFYESVSDDGSAWTPLTPSALISSDSPAGLVRLSDGRQVLLWNKCLRYPYAYGGRHVLHGAVSHDDGATWVGHREVARDPRRYEPPPPRGDHGTAYPFPVVLPDDTVLVTTGQGAGRVVVAAVDPAWLEERSQRACFDLPTAAVPGSAGPASAGGTVVGTDAPAAPVVPSPAAAPAGGSLPEDGTQVPETWSAFGCRGVRRRDDLEGAGSGALEVARLDPAWPACAVWNHPLGRRGRLRLRLRLAPGCEGVRLLLTDHFSVPFDPEDALAAMFALCLVPASTAMFDEPDRAVPEGEARAGAPAGAWCGVELAWDCDARRGTARVDGSEPVSLPQRRLGDGICYLRLRPSSPVPGPGFAVTDVAVEVEPPARS